jgi:hypothetical protein
MAVEACCTHCHTRRTLDDRWAGQTIRCKRCKQIVAIAGTSEPKARPSAPSGPPAPATKRSRFRLVLASCIGCALLAVASVILVIILLIRPDVEQKLGDLKGTDQDARAQALVWLAEADPQDASRAQVTSALEPLLFEGDLHAVLNPDLVLRAYLHWAGPDNVPTLIRMVKNPTLPAWSAAKTGLVMEALGKLGDRQAIQTLADKLPDPALREQAVSALQWMGSKAEPAVLDYLFDADAGTRQRASQLLEDYGTRPETIAAAALDRLESNVPDDQLSAALWFAADPPSGAAPRAEVAKLLAKLLDDPSPKINAAALRALNFWATKESLSALVAYARRQKKMAAADPVLIDVLAQFPDASAAEAIALRLRDTSQRDRAAQALLKLGPAATPAVLPYINYPDAPVQKEARRVARQLNVPADRQLEQTLTDLASTWKKRGRAALQYLAKLRPDEANRAKVSKLLNLLLLDPDVGIRDDALCAVQVWGTKENTTTLLDMLGTFQDRGPGRNLRVIEVLGSLKDPAAAGTLAQGLTHDRERGPVSKALIAIGPAAETAVIPFVESPDGWTRLAACQVLGEIGTRQCLEPLQKAAQLYFGDPIFTRQAEIASQKVMARK